MGYIAPMDGPIVHLCYAGISGATAVAMDIAAGSNSPTRHAFVLYGRCEPNPSHARRLRQMGCRWRYVRKRGPLDVPGCWRTARAIRSLNPTAVLFHGVRTFPVMPPTRWLTLGVPRILVAHSAVELLDTVFWRAVARMAMGMCSAVIAVSLRQREWLCGLTGRFRRPPSVTHIPNGLDAAFWTQAASAPSELSPPYRLAMVGALVPAKGQRTLLEACGVLQEKGMPTRVTLVGDGPARPMLEDCARKLGLAEAVTFTGGLPPEGVRDVLADCDVYVHTSAVESFGLAIAEAMLTGRPVVAADGPAARELVTPETGWLFPPKDADALAETLLCVKADPQEAARRAPNARDFVRTHHDRGEMAAAYERIVEAVVQNRMPR
ncbi:MAG: glycosyltransferase family 4 protein [Phycisphaerae bacterium]